MVEAFYAPNVGNRQRTFCYLGRLDGLKPCDWRRVAERLADRSWLPPLMDEVGYLPHPTSKDD